MFVVLYFLDRFIIWVMICIKNIKYLFNINGGLCGYFEGKKGL